MNCKLRITNLNWHGRTQLVAMQQLYHYMMHGFSPMSVHLFFVQVESVQVVEKERDSMMRYIQKQLVAVVPPDMVRQGGWVGLHHSHTPLLLHSTSLSTPPDHASRRSDVLSPSHPPDELLTALKDTEEELERQRAYLDLLLSVVIERDPETLGMLSDVQKK